MSTQPSPALVLVGLGASLGSRTCSHSPAAQPGTQASFIHPLIRTHHLHGMSRHLFPGVFSKCPLRAGLCQAPKCTTPSGDPRGSEGPRWACCHHSPPPRAQIPVTEDPHLLTLGPPGLDWAPMVGGRRKHGPGGRAPGLDWAPAGSGEVLLTWGAPGPQLIASRV